uniref:Uncharacterized protein n=1 Tax=Anguilla anguilla TaxID=7936 RepID=A0A0E9SW60_ANGAN
MLSLCIEGLHLLSNLRISVEEMTTSQSQARCLYILSTQVPPLTLASASIYVKAQHASCSLELSSIL